MARKVAKKPEDVRAADQAPEAPPEKVAGPEGSAETSDRTDGTDAAPGEPAGAQGGDAINGQETIGADVPLFEVDLAGNAPQPDAGAEDDGGPDDDTSDGAVTVTCLAEGGRRRLGRRWPAGPTTVPVGILSAEDIAILQGDPRFVVTLTEP